MLSFWQLILVFFFFFWPWRPGDGKAVHCDVLSDADFVPFGNDGLTRILGDIAVTFDEVDSALLQTQRAQWG